jgi:hypothetical protein
MPRGGIRPICSVANCGRPHKSKGYCDTHYWRLRKHGDPNKLLPKEERKCSVDGCDRDHCAQGFCKMHYSRMNRRGTLAVTKLKQNPYCSVEGCQNQTLAKNLCARHYERWQNHGDPLYQRKKTALEYIRSDVLPYAEEACLLWPYAIDEGGYGRVTFEGKQTAPHRVVCTLAYGPQPSPSHQAAHTCGDRACVSPKHLRWATRAENMADKVRHGTHCRGERQHNSKLTREQVAEIRNLGVTTGRAAMAKRFGVSRAAIGAIIRGESWAWLD